MARVVSTGKENMSEGGGGQARRACAPSHGQSRPEGWVLVTTPGRNTCPRAKAARSFVTEG